MSEDPERVCLFDLDGTLADFDGAMERGMRALASPMELAHGDWFPREQSSEPDHIRSRRRMIKTQPGFWRNLEPLTTGFRLLHMALGHGFQISICSKAPRTNFPAWTEKIEWCHANLPMNQEGIAVSLVENKGLVYGRVLVDDYPPYITGWLAHRPRGWVIMPAQSWNESFVADRVVRVRPDNEADFALADEVFKRRK